MMKRILSHLLSLLSPVVDAVVPLRARAHRVRVLEEEDIPRNPTVHELLRNRITTLMDYEDARVAALIQSLKYDGSGRATRLLASAIADYLREEIAAHKAFSQKNVLLVPVPLHASRKRERGFNQVQAVLDALPREFKVGPA